MPSIRTGKTLVRKATANTAPSFVLGSRPPSLRAQPPGSLTIKPQPGNKTQYGKQPSVAGAGFGNTGLTGES